MFLTPTESLAPWVLLLEQESYLSYIKKDDKKDFAKYRPISLLNLDYQIYNTILINCMQKKLDVLLGDKQPAAIENRTILHFSF